MTPIAGVKPDDLRRARDIGAPDRSAEGCRNLPDQVLIGKEILKSLPRGVSLDVDIPAKVSRGELVEHCRFRSVLAERGSVQSHGIAPLVPFPPLFRPPLFILPPDTRLLRVGRLEIGETSGEYPPEIGIATDTLLDELPGEPFVKASSMHRNGDSLHEPARDLAVVRGKRLIQAPAPEIGRPLGAKQASLDGSHALCKIRRTGATRDTSGNDLALYPRVRTQPSPDRLRVTRQRSEPTIRCDPEPVEQASRIHIVPRHLQETGQEGEQQSAPSQRLK